MQAAGAWSVKSYNQPRRDQRQQVIEAARQLNMSVVPEGGSLYQHNMSMIVDGHTTIEHSIPLARLYDDVHQLWRQTNVSYNPTIVVAYGGSYGENYWYQESQVWNDPILTQYVPRRQLDARARRPVTAPDNEWNHISVAREATRLANEGVNVQIGAHGQREGLAAHWEMWSLAQGGMAPLEVIRAGTLNGAKGLGLDRDLGSLEVGKLADMVVLNSNPLDNIRNTTAIAYTDRQRPRVRQRHERGRPAPAAASAVLVLGRGRRGGIDDGDRERHPRPRQPLKQYSPSPHGEGEEFDLSAISLGHRIVAVPDLAVGERAQQLDVFRMGPGQRAWPSWCPGRGGSRGPWHCRRRPRPVPAAAGRRWRRTPCPAHRSGGCR